MARITITPQWAKLLDFETTLPSDVERLVRETQARAARVNGRRKQPWRGHTAPAMVGLVVGTECLSGGRELDVRDISARRNVGGV